jgi:hypothetical protein
MAAGDEDPFDGRGLHETYQIVNQRGPMREHCEALVTHFDMRLGCTNARAPCRRQEFRLVRDDLVVIPLAGEDLLSRAIWSQWRVADNVCPREPFLADFCRHIQTFGRNRLAAMLPS